MVVYTGFLCHVTITWQEAIGLCGIREDRGSWWCIVHVHRTFGFGEMKQNVQKTFFYSLRVEHCSWRMLLGRWQSQCDHGGCAPNGAASRNAPWGRVLHLPYTHNLWCISLCVAWVYIVANVWYLLSRRQEVSLIPMQATPTYMQYMCRKARRACEIWDTTWVTLEQKGAKVAFF